MASQEGLSRYCMKGWGEDRSAKVDRVWGWTCPVSSEMHSKGLAVWCWSWDHGGAGGLGRAGRREVEEEESRVRGGQPDQAAVVPVLSCRCCRTVVAALAASEPCSRSASWSSSLDLEGLHSRAPSVLRIQGNKGSRLRRHELECDGGKDFLFPGSLLAVWAWCEACRAERVAKRHLGEVAGDI